MFLKSAFLSQGGGFLNFSKNATIKAMPDIKPKLRRLDQKLKKDKRFSFIWQLYKKFPKAEIYLVGGVVRDVLLAREIKDYDFVVRRVAPKTLEKFLASPGKVNLVGKTFGVYKFIPKSYKLKAKSFDIALPRTEHSLKHTGQRRDFKVNFSANLPIEEDLSRRDFTVNALAYEIRNQKLVDLFGGLSHLQKKVIKTVGEPQERFKEDYARLLRALRFACQLDFKIENKTWANLKKLIKHLNDEHQGERVVPREVMAAEFLKAFYYNPVQALKLYDQSGALEVLIPELLKMKNCPQPENWHSEGDVWQHTVLALKNLHSKKFQKEFPQGINLDVMIAVLFHDIAKPPTLQTPEKHGTDRIRFNEHERLGAKMFKEIASRLKLASPPDIQINVEKIAWLIQRHLLLLHGQVDQMKDLTMERYFFKRPDWGEDFLKLIYVDALSTIPPSGKPDLTNYKKLVKRIERLRDLGRGRKKELPKNLLDGDEIMKILQIKPGPQVGQYKEKLREAQLGKKIKTKKEAEIFLKKLCK